MLRASIAGVTTFAATLAASAADLPTRKGPPMVPVYSFLWTGFYVGAQVGYQWNQADFTVLSPPPPAVLAAGSYNFDGVIGGVHAGYNWQHGKAVFGVEADIEASGGSGSGVIPGQVPVIAGGQLNWQGSLRARLGYAHDRTLFYLTGGVAVGGFEFTLNTIPPGVPARFSDTLYGWTVGAGVEHAFSDRWTARIEYRYTDWRKASGGILPLTAFPAASRQIHDPDSHAVRVGVSYRFGG